ncbi:N-acetylglucosamine kinase [Cohnella zeiphila]|uniref:ATPase BadF/BadG/BcrA/BcrD type domain-containing protein n=1 Tax=Cohnella zeiphila TaxID=2761120 RepID=A0A7X0SNA1_9BACL|nr:BadF/BadG/BcrA/BcrD ATPase family protein [Cohnella zeiphila]MBB6730878.1 hypothetical protein [Cohnella zeiphila]
MSYYLSVDGGGTKVAAILFDEDFKCLSTGKGGSANILFDSSNVIEDHISACLDQIFTGKVELVIDVLHLNILGPAELFLKALRKRAKLQHLNIICEGQMGLLAGTQRLNGIVAVAGTGSCVYGYEGSQEASIGGWGSLIGDEGSGFHVGKEGIMAAIRAYEYWGPSTLLQPMIMEAWGLNSMTELVSRIYGTAWRSIVSSAAPVVSQAALAGDETAIRIFKQAGEKLALQTIALIAKDSLPPNLPITIAGSVWKGHPSMYERFREVIADSYPEALVVKPIFEPVVGGVIRQAVSDRGELQPSLLNRLRNEYAAFLY